MRPRDFYGAVCFRSAYRVLGTLETAFQNKGLERSPLLAGEVIGLFDDGPPTRGRLMRTAQLRPLQSGGTRQSHVVWHQSSASKDYTTYCQLPATLF